MQYNKLDPPNPPNPALMLNYAELETSGNYQCYSGVLLSESIQVNITADNKITKLKADKVILIFSWE